MKPATVFNAASLLAASAILGWMGYETYLQATAPPLVQQVHGEGKRPLSCDMTQLLISYRGETRAHDVNAIINLEGEGRVHEGSKRMSHSKVMPMVELLKQYPEAASVEFIPCEEHSGTRVDVATLQQDPFNYLLSFSNTRRARVIVYRMKGKRARYSSAVKNLHHIVFHTNS